jgi:hypothetical protein
MIALACPHCDASLNIRQDMAGRRGKCPKCNQPIDVPLGSTPSIDAPLRQGAERAASKNASPDEVLSALRDAIGKAAASQTLVQPRLAALVCKVLKVIHFLLPLALAAATLFHYFMHGPWAVDAADTPGSLIYWLLLSVGALLTAMSLMSHVSPPRARPPESSPLEPAAAPHLAEVVDELATQLKVPAPRLRTWWDSTLSLYDDPRGGELHLGASALAILSTAEVTGVIARDLAVQRSCPLRVVRREVNRFRRIMGEASEPLAEGALTRIAQVLSIPGRPVVWPLLVIAKAVGEKHLRQAEFDADALQCELVGSRGMLTTFQRQRLIRYSCELATVDLSMQHRERQLQTNRVRTVEENFHSLPPEVQQSLLEQPVDDPPPGDYRPTWEERSATVQSLARPGIVATSAGETTPANARASVLVADFEALCRDVTWLDASRRFGPLLKRRDLR